MQLTQPPNLFGRGSEMGLHALVMLGQAALDVLAVLACVLLQALCTPGTSHSAMTVRPGRISPVDHHGP